jgi:secreted Zn-dependent insulinase-like peptidase
LEGVVDDMLQLFLRSIADIKVGDLEIVKRSVLAELVEFSVSLEDVTQRYFDDVEDSLLDQNELEYQDVVKAVDQLSLRNFAEEFLVRQSKRLTIELFANQITTGEEQYRLQKNFSLNQREYSIVTLEELRKRKNAN